MGRTLEYDKAHQKTVAEHHRDHPEGRRRMRVKVRPTRKSEVVDETLTIIPMQEVTSSFGGNWGCLTDGKRMRMMREANAGMLVWGRFVEK